MALVVTFGGQLCILYELENGVCNTHRFYHDGRLPGGFKNRAGDPEAKEENMAYSEPGGKPWHAGRVQIPQFLY